MKLKPTLLFFAFAIASPGCGAARALNLIDSLAARGQVSEYHLLHAARGRFLQQLGRLEEAGAAYRAALDLATLEPERRLLAARMASLAAPTRS